jgi:hypothetical protein
MGLSNRLLAWLFDGVVESANEINTAPIIATTQWHGRDDTMSIHLFNYIGMITQSPANYSINIDVMVQAQRADILVAEKGKFPECRRHDIFPT